MQAIIIVVVGYAFGIVLVVFVAVVVVVAVLSHSILRLDFFLSFGRADTFYLSASKFRAALCSQFQTRFELHPSLKYL